METLLEVVEQIERSGASEAVRWSNGLRTWIWTYRDLHIHIATFAGTLKTRAIRRGDRIMIWGENRPEWLAAFWGAVASGVTVIPVDYRFSPELARRIQQESQPKLLVHGDTVDTSALSTERIHFDDIEPGNAGCSIPAASISPEDVVEIVYTSGTTGEPKGVVHRHRNICSNLEPFRTEINKYKKWARPFQPIRILNLLPLSHMFGQSLGLFIPVLLGGSVVFTDEMRPAAILQLVRHSRTSVIVSVPRILESLEHEVERRFVIPPVPSTKGLPGLAVRWWRSRGIRSAFGWKFWALVVGGARLDPVLEEFWTNLGYAVIQGYGLTEASPVVAVNHPFDMQRGSLGRIVPGQDVRIAPDGEILIRGENVTGVRGGWLATGDLGEMDAEGRLYFRGRKKDLIITPEGLNVHPDDVEAVLNTIEGVQESAVVARHESGGEQVHAVLILSDPSADPAKIVGVANQRLESHQRIRGWTRWPEADFPRTASTFKIRRHEIANYVAGRFGPIAPRMPEKTALDELLERDPTTRLAEDLGLSSLERVELLSELESRYGLELDEGQFSKINTVQEMRSLVESAQSGGTRVRSNSSLAERAISAKASDDPISGNWPQFPIIRIFRSVMQNVLVLPLFRHYLPLTVEGLKNLEDISRPVIFAANHTSHLDTVALIAALPADWRRTLAPAMSKDHFRDWFEKHSATKGVQYALARSVFNAYPLPQRMSGVKAALTYTADLVQRGYCPLIFPEGQRTLDGTIHPFRPGVALMSLRLRVPVIPTQIQGLYEVLSAHDSWPKAGSVRVLFGKPMRFDPHTSVEEAAAAIERAVRDLKRSC